SLLAPYRIADRLTHGGAGYLGIRIAGELGGGRLVAIDHRVAVPLVQPRQRFVTGSDDQVAPEQQIGFASGDAHGVDIALPGGDAHVGGHRAEFLCQARLVQHRATLAFQVRSHAQQCAEGCHATAADTRDQHVPRPLQGRPLRLRQGRRLDPLGHRLWLAQAAAMHGDEARAETLDAGIILVAGVLVDLALAPQFGFQRQYRQAVGFLSAIATALAYGGVDEHALGRVFQLAALAAAAFLGGAGLVVNDHRDALELAQLALHGIQLAAVMETGVGRETGAAGVFIRLVTDDGDALDALVGHLPA